MLRGDIKRLASDLGVSRSTIFRRAKKYGISLIAIRGRDNNTTDMFSGETLIEEHRRWYEQIKIFLGENHVSK